MNHSAWQGESFLYAFELSLSPGQQTDMMCSFRVCLCWPTLLCWFFAPRLSTAMGSNITLRLPERSSCKPEGGEGPVPCPRGTFGPSFWATSINDCISCPPHHYGPREALSNCLPCGPWSQQPLPGQHSCTCLQEGQVFQASDGQCPCTLGYVQKGEACVLKVYEICKDGRARNQHGECLDHKQWKQYCCQQVCPSPELYEGYDGSLGLCACRGLSRPEPDRVECVGWCRSILNPVLQLVSMSGSMLETVLKHWDSRGSLECNVQLNFSRPVYTVQTGEAGFFGLLNAVPVEVRRLILAHSQETNRHFEPLDTEQGNIKDKEEDWDSHWSSKSSAFGTSDMRPGGVLNPTACLHPGDILLFTVTQQHYPQYDVDSLYNTNAAFDWGPFRLLAQDQELARSAHSLFSISLHEPGYVRVVPAGGECYDTGPFFPSDPHHLTRMGIAQRRQLLLRPDWTMIGGLLVGAVVILCLCVTILILFREYGWPEKLPAQARYRDLQLRYNMDDYSSKGSRVVAVKKTHRNLQVGLTEDSVQRAVALVSNEFWDYEEQVDLEAFSSSTFYDILLKHSVSVTVRLGQLRGEVKQLYQGVLGKLRGLHPGWRMFGGKTEGLERQVEQEMVRRRALGNQLTQLLDSQLQILRVEMRAQQVIQKTFRARLREGVRLLRLLAEGHTLLWDKHIKQQYVMERQILESQRLGAWVVLKEGTGAQLLCPATGSVLSREDIIAPDGSVRACDAVHVDPLTGLIQPNSNTHMLLASAHSMPVPPDFFLHPQTGKLLPVAGNVGFDPASSTLVGKWESPLLPFIPYPPSRHAEIHAASKLRGLRSGQRLVFGGPMCDCDTGVLVPILAVTIHPQTGLVYPLGGVHTCPISRLRQPIQIGCPMLDPRTGDLVLITGVSLDPHTGAVLPVGGLLLNESFIEPLSGRMVRVGGGSVRGGKVVPHAGGFQALLDSQALGACLRVAELLQGVSEEWSSAAADPQGDLDRLSAATSELEQAWKSSQHCVLQLLSRLEVVQEQARGVAENGGSVGSSLHVPVLGAQLDWVSGCMVPLAGTMEDADGKGLVPIRFGAQTVDPVTGVLSPVVGANLDVWKRTVVPITVSQILTLGENPDTVTVEALQKESSVRGNYWREQTLKEEEMVGDFDRAVKHYLSTSIHESDCIDWMDTDRQLRETAAEIQESAQCEAQRKALQNSELSLLIPAHDGELREQELWEQLMQRQAELDAALSSLRCARQVCQLRADTAQSLVSGTFWYKDFDMLQPKSVRNPLKVIAMTQQKILPRLERLIQLLEETKALGQSTSTQRQQSSGKQAFGCDSASRAWTESVSVVKGVSTQSFKDQMKAPSASEQNATVPSLPLSNPSYAQKSQEKTQLNHSQDVRSLQEPGLSAHISVPQLAEEDWSRLVALSPLFQLMKEVEQQLRDSARDRGLHKIQPSGAGRSFVDFMDAQWECEGELIQVSSETLNPRQLLLYQHGQFLLQHLHLHKMEGQKTLFVRSQRLQSVGGLSLLLMHCAAHISTGQMSTDSTPAFQRAFFKVLQVGLSELFHARLGQTVSPDDERTKDLQSLDGLLLERLQKPSPGIFSEDEVLGRLRKYREASVFRQVESLLKESPKSLEINHLNTDPSLNDDPDSQDAAPP
ncbi:Teneurin-4 [Labeo rohita]|uniref:Teneurin-4 n=1 Tax=Labeo rohita TaxID=84645 RepID=A0ABQ8M012_LABRO|nr:Teneurin-4 [Labeo rohita]